MTMQHTASHCNNTPLHTATHCNTLQHTALDRSSRLFNRFATHHNNTLQHPSTHKNTQKLHMTVNQHTGVWTAPHSIHLQRPPKGHRAKLGEFAGCTEIRKKKNFFPQKEPYFSRKNLNFHKKGKCAKWVRWLDVQA